MSENLTPPPPPPQKKSSTGKIIAWVGCGCLGLIAVVVIAFALIFAGVFKAMKSSDVYKDTLAAAQSNPAAVEALGEPIKAGFFVSGSVNINNGEGSAELTIPVKGPKGSGEIHAVASKASGSTEWVYSTRELRVSGNAEAIPLGR